MSRNTQRNTETRADVDDFCKRTNCFFVLARDGKKYPEKNNRISNKTKS